jgi:hypothetical protein
LRFARIVYRWHPLFGRTLQVSPYRRGKELKCIYTNERPDLCRELPNWMFDEAYCGGMTLGLPEVNLVALYDLGRVLALLKKTRTRAARFSSRDPKEKRGAKKNAGVGTTGAPYVPPVARDTPGLIEAVVALLLAAAAVPEVEKPAIKSGGVDEQ